jgi:hypothetical protein
VERETERERQRERDREKADILAAVVIVMCHVKTNEKRMAYVILFYVILHQFLIMYT